GGEHLRPLAGFDVGEWFDRSRGARVVDQHRDLLVGEIGRQRLHRSRIGDVDGRRTARHGEVCHGLVDLRAGPARGDHLAAVLGQRRAHRPAESRTATGDQCRASGQRGAHTDTPDAGAPESAEELGSDDAGADSALPYSGAHGNEAPAYLAARMSPERACPSNSSTLAALPHTSPSRALAAGSVISWYVTVLRYLPTHSPPV